MHVSSVFSKPFPLCIFSCTTTFSLFFIGFLQSFTGISSSLSKGILVPLPLIFCTGVSCKGYPLKSPLGIDGLVKGILPFISATREGEGKRSFFPFFDVTLVEDGTSSNPGGDGGEKYLCGKGQTSSSAYLTCLLIFEIGALPFLFLLIPILVLVGDEELAICDWGAGVVSNLK